MNDCRPIPSFQFTLMQQQLLLLMLWASALQLCAAVTMWVQQGQTFASFLPRSGFGAAVFDANNLTGVGVVVAGGTTSNKGLMDDTYEAQFGTVGRASGTHARVVHP